MQNGCLDFATAILRKTLICRLFPSTRFSEILYHPENSLPECLADCTAGGKNDRRRLQHAFAAWRARYSGSRRYRVLLQWCAVEKGGREVLLQWENVVTDGGEGRVEGCMMFKGQRRPEVPRQWLAAPWQV